MKPVDLATRDHWDVVHAGADRVPRYGVTRPERLLDTLILEQLDPQSGQTLVELGAGDTAYLPHLALRFGYRVAGLDYSPLGVQLAKRNLEAFGVEGDVREADFFVPPVDWINRFNVVASFGLIEHFDDTVAAIRACGRYLASDGLMLTVVPNMGGLPGIAQRLLSGRIYRAHRALTASALAAAHTQADLDVECAAYLAGLNAWTLSSTGGSVPARLLHNALKFATLGVWAIEDRGLVVPPNRMTSPWIVVVARARTR